MKSVFFIIASLVSSLHYALAGNPSELEQQVKAVCMYNFAKFVEWPKESFSSPSADIQICVLGDPPLASILEQRKDLRAQDRTIVLKRLSKATADQEISSCHLFYWDSRKDTLSEKVSQTLQSKAIVSVSEEGKQSAASVVQFQLIDNRVKFSIEKELAHKLGLLLSPQLLKLSVR